MKFVKQSFEIIPQEEGINGIFKQIELAARTCYKSQDKITENSAKDFVEMLIKNKHYAMLEHGTVYLNIPDAKRDWHQNLKYIANPYSKIGLLDFQNNFSVVTNYRVLIENNWLDDLEFLCEPTEYHRRITVKLTTDQGILREFTRHRRFSFAVESTRYCNYSKNKFSNEIIYIQPNWISDEDIENYNKSFEYFADADENHNVAVNRFISSLKNAEYFYMELLKLGWQPQQARNVLPLATKCEMIMTGFVSDWEDFFRLRADSHAHPQAQELAYAIKDEFIKRGYIK